VGPVGRAVTAAAVLACALAVAGGVTLVVLTEEGPESNVPAGTAAALARALADEGVTVVLLRAGSGQRQLPEPRSAELEEARS